MIIKKPYAFIIRHFKIINLIIAGCIAFLSFNATTLQEQFVSLKASKMYTYAGAEYLINNNIDTYTFNNYKFGIVERKKTKKPDKDEIHNIIYNEIKDKMTKNTDVIKTTDNILNDIINGGEVEKVKKVNIKKLKNNQPKNIKFNKKSKTN